MKKVIKHIIRFLGFFAFMGFLSPFVDCINPLNAYKDPEHWIAVFVSVSIVYPIIVYIYEINPRKFYYCVDQVLVTIVWLLLFFGLFATIIILIILENIVFKIILLVSSVLVFLFIIHAFVHRGIAVYSKGKIRIFKFKIKTYSTDKIDDITFEYNGKKCTVNIIVCGEDNIFRIPSSSAKRFEPKLKSLKKL